MDVSLVKVAYDSSDDSDAECEEKPVGEIVNCPNRTVLINSGNVSNEDVEDEEVEIILKTSKQSKPDEDSSDGEEEPVQIAFSNLPKPNYHTFRVDEIKMKNLKLTGLMKVIPAGIKSSKWELRSNQKLNFQKESGLLSILPKPENENFSEISKVFKLPSKLIPTVAKTAASNEPKKAIIKTSDVTANPDEDEDVGTDFFSLSVDNSKEEPHEDIYIDLPNLEKDDSSNNFLEPQPLFMSRTERNEVKNVDIVRNDENLKNRADLDGDLIRKLSGRKRKGSEEIQIIDINEAEILAESKRISEKHFTDEVMCNPAPKRSSASTLSKRKHQITYLAFQARERELELKNQWAENRMTRKQTQSKYGF